MDRLTQPHLSSDLAALAWLLTSPPLLCDAAPALVGSVAVVQRFSSSDIDTITCWLNELKAEPGAFIDFMAEARQQARTSNAPRRLLDEPLRLGRLAERLMAFYLRFGSLHSHVASNLPIRTQALNGERTTAGEIDFLLFAPSGEPLHWELAVKYFLCQSTSDVAMPSDFKGPDSAETFDYKLHKLLVRQLRHPAPDPHAAVHWHPQAVARGWMFYRWGQRVPRCEALSLDHLRGWWLPLCELTRLNPAHLYMELPRSRWMPLMRAQAAELWSLRDLTPALVAAWQAQVACSDAAHAFPRIARAQALGRMPSARLVAEMSPCELADDGTWVEVARYFVMPDLAQIGVAI